MKKDREKAGVANDYKQRWAWRWQLQLHIEENKHMLTRRSECYEHNYNCSSLTLGLGVGYFIRIECKGSIILNHIIGDSFKEFNHLATYNKVVEVWNKQELGVCAHIGRLTTFIKGSSLLFLIDFDNVASSSLNTCSSFIVKAKLWSMSELGGMGYQRRTTICLSPSLRGDLVV